YDLITAADSSPILLLYGQSGVGKSSLLAAGLLPRLEFSHDVHYLRRDRSLGLLGTLLQYLQPGNDPPEMAWRRIEAAEGRPLVLVLDQAEEAFTRPVPDLPDEIKIFANGLRQIFTQPDARPQGRLILGFCKEWLAEIATALNDQGLRWEHQFLKALDRNGIIDAVTGPTRSERLCRKYRLWIEEGLAEEIADDLLVDPDSPVAPTLQILLTKLWEEAKERNREDPRFDRALYQKLRKGSALGPFIDEQLAGLEKVRAGDLRSGLALDLLAYHTTPKGTAEQHTDEDLQQHYCHIKDRVAEIVQWFKGGFVLTDLHTEQAPIKGSRLAHDTLAPFVRERFDRSDWPGQRARRILENRAVDWGKGQTGPVLDDTDLDLVEKGAAGMRCLEPDEERLIAASRRARNWRRALSGFFVAALVVAAVSVLYQWQQTESQKRIAIARLQTYEAVKVAEKNPIRALLLAAEAVKRPFDASGIRFGDA
ncbi:ATP-binding protein, partial [bacterium]|nr:ATP-binding protein [bacterium]